MIIEQLYKINAWRDPELLKRKWAKMASNPVAFFRWSAVLFYQALEDRLTFESPWWRVCGDLHVENFGTMRWLAGQIDFDINDFDEANWWQIHRDLTRLVTSIAIVYRMFGSRIDDSARMIAYTQDRYVSLLLDGKVGDLSQIDEDTPVQHHISKKLIYKDQDRLIDKLTKHNRIVRSDEFQELLPSECEEVDRVISQILSHVRGTKVLDVVRRVNGNASLWLLRYAVLIQWHDKHHRHILDIKQSISSILHWHRSHAHWDTESERIVSIQKMMQDDSPLLLSTVMIGKNSFVIKEMQPTEDKIIFDPEDKHSIHRKLIDEMVYALVRAQISSCDVLGAVSLPQLMDYAQILQSNETIQSFSLEYADLNHLYYDQFCDELLFGKTDNKSTK